MILHSQGVRWGCTPEDASLREHPGASSAPKHALILVPRTVMRERLVWVTWDTVAPQRREARTTASRRSLDLSVAGGSSGQGRGSRPRDVGSFVLA